MKGKPAVIDALQKALAEELMAISQYFLHGEMQSNWGYKRLYAEIKKQAEKVLELVQHGGDFAKLAKQYSEDPGSKDKGGDLGWILKGQTVPEFQQVAFSLPVGQLSDLVKSQYGYHIFLVEASRPAVHLALKDVTDEIHGKLLAKKEEEAYQQWLQDLRAQATIKIHWTLL